MVINLLRIPPLTGEARWGQFLQLLTYADEAHADVLGSDAHDGADLFVAEVFEPQQHDGAVEGLEPHDALVEEFRLVVFDVRVIKQVDAVHDRLVALRLLAAVDADAGVERHAINP